MMNVFKKAASYVVDTLWEATEVGRSLKPEAAAYQHWTAILGALVFFGIGLALSLQSYTWAGIGVMAFGIVFTWCGPQLIHFLYLFGFRWREEKDRIEAYKVILETGQTTFKVYSIGGKDLPYDFTSNKYEVTFEVSKDYMDLMYEILVKRGISPDEFFVHGINLAMSEELCRLHNLDSAFNSESSEPNLKRLLEFEAQIYDA